MRPFCNMGYVTLPADCVPDRPWWKRMSNAHAASRTDFQRSDGVRLALAEADAARELAAYDTAHPVAPPRIQPGQVWILDEPQTRLAVTVSVQTPLPPWAKYADLGKFMFSHSEPAVLLNGFMLSVAAAEQLLLRGTSRWSAYLIFDPFNPTGSIWTGARYVPNG